MHDLPHRKEMLGINDISIDEDMWGAGSEMPVKTWLASMYDPETMPLLACATIQGKPGVWLLGWNHEGTDFPPLLSEIFGEGYAVAQLDQFEAHRKMIARMKDEGTDKYGLGREH